MSDELKRCPFCGGEASMQRFNVSTTPGRIICQCGIELRAVKGQSVEDIVEQWNTRAAVTDEQFAMAVHDGRALQRVRECHMVSVSLYDEEGVDGIECDECGWSDVHEWYDPMPEFCPECGAKVAPC